MPELPEVETTARGLQRRLVGREVIATLGISWPPTLANVAPEELEALLAGRRVTEVGRRGKFVLIHLDDGAILAVHRRMTGNLIVRAAGEPPEKHTRLILDLDDGAQLRFVDPRKFGRVYYYQDFATAQDQLNRVAGPEPLDDLTPARLTELLGGRRGRLKALLLDQRFLAGLGNLYADEILWLARLHPEHGAATLSADEIGRLADAIGRVLRNAIERRGTSLNDYRDAEGEPGENQDFLEAYGRAGAPCRRCGAPIVKYWLGQRGTHLCPGCQPGASAVASS